MPGAARSCENQCGYFFKSIILLLTMAAVGLGIAGCLQCEFLLIDLSTGAGAGWDVILDIIPVDVTSVWVGVFQWGAAVNGERIGECQTYDTLLGNSVSGTADYIKVAQGCAIAAPVIGFVGVLLSCSELICCSCFGSCIFAFVFFFVASGVQMGVFGMLSSPGWCPDLDSEECFDDHINRTTFWIFLLAGFFYFLSSLLLCCSPRPDPCLQNKNSREEDDYASTKQHEPETFEEPEIHHSPQNSHDQPHYVETY